MYSPPVSNKNTWCEPIVYLQNRVKQRRHFITGAFLDQRHGLVSLRFRSPVHHLQASDVRAVNRVSKRISNMPALVNVSPICLHSQMYLRDK